MRMRKSRKQVLESRIRDIRRKLLHQRDAGLRKMWKEHIEYLELELKGVI